MSHISYIYKDNIVYKIAKEAVDLDKLFNKTIVLYKESNEDSLNTILFIFIVLFTMYICIILEKVE